MTTATIIGQAAADGVLLEMSADGTLEASGDAEVVARWLPMLRDHKDEIMAALAPATTSWRWLLHFADREPLEICCNPDASHAKVMGQYPDALAAEPLPERTRRTASPQESAELRQLVTSCATELVDAGRTVVGYGLLRAGYRTDRRLPRLKRRYGLLWLILTPQWPAGDCSPLRTKPPRPRMTGSPASNACTLKAACVLSPVLPESWWRSRATRRSATYPGAAKRYAPGVVDPDRRQGKYAGRI